MLASLWPELGDYHQGLGFVVSFLLLVLPPVDVLRLCVGLHRAYLRGYFKAAPTAYVRDARVFQKILDQRDPQLGAHLKQMACAEAYASKWFVGLNVHVLTFEALFLFLEELLARGEEFLFMFALSLVENCRDELLAANNPADVLEILRLEDTRYGNAHKAKGSDEEGSFFKKIVQDAAAISLEWDDSSCMHAVLLCSSRSKRLLASVRVVLCSEESTWNSFVRRCWSKWRKRPYAESCATPK